MYIKVEGYFQLVTNVIEKRQGNWVISERGKKYFARTRFTVSLSSTQELLKLALSSEYRNIFQYKIYAPGISCKILEEL